VNGKNHFSFGKDRREICPQSVRDNGEQKIRRPRKNGYKKEQRGGEGKLKSGHFEKPQGEGTQIRGKKTRQKRGQEKLGAKKKVSLKKNLGKMRGGRQKKKGKKKQDEMKNNQPETLKWTSPANRRICKMSHLTHKGKGTRRGYPQSTKFKGIWKYRHHNQKESEGTDAQDVALERSKEKKGLVLVLESPIEKN